MVPSIGIKIAARDWEQLCTDARAVHPLGIQVGNLRVLGEFGYHIDPCKSYPAGSEEGAVFELSSNRLDGHEQAWNF